MNWNDLTILLAVARSSTMTEAAQSLNVAQTTVARRLTALEEALGVQLVDRRRDGVTLTEDGRDALRSAEQMEGLAFELERALLGGSERLAGRLRVTTVDMITHYHPELFAEFARAYPNIELEVQVGYAVRSLARREADLALRFAARPEGHLIGRRLARAEYAVFGCPSIADPERSLAEHPWVTWSESAGAKLSERWMKRAVPRPTIVCRYDTALALHAAVQAGVGVGLMPCIYGRDLVQLSEPILELGYDLWALSHEDLATTARVRAFLDHVATYFTALRPAFAGHA